MGCEEGELPNPSAGDSSRQRSGREVLRGNGPHKNSGIITPPLRKHAAVVKGAGAQMKGKTAAPLSSLSWFGLCLFSLLVPGKTPQGGPLIPQDLHKQPL